MQIVFNESDTKLEPAVSCSALIIVGCCFPLPWALRPPSASIFLVPQDATGTHEERVAISCVHNNRYGLVRTKEYVADNARMPSTAIRNQSLLEIGCLNQPLMVNIGGFNFWRHVGLGGFAEINRGSNRPPAVFFKSRGTAVNGHMLAVNGHMD